MSQCQLIGTCYITDSFISLVIGQFLCRYVIPCLMTHLFLNPCQQNYFHFSVLGSKFSQELRSITEVATFQFISYLQEHKFVFKKMKVAKTVINPYQNSTSQALQIVSCILVLYSSMQCLKMLEHYGNQCNTEILEKTL